MILIAVIGLLLCLSESAPATSAPLCSPCPMCDAGWVGYMPPLKECLPFYAAELKDKSVKASCLGYLLKNVKGQDKALEAIHAALLFKLESPSSPLVMHFAGDNGVGKTLSVELISKALSKRCKNPPSCSYGDNLLKIHGTAYGGIDLPTARSSIVKSVADHLGTYPHGIILVDDVAQMNASLAQALGPLFGKEGFFVEYPNVLLSDAIIILTSDFGEEGRTRGKRGDELVRMIHEEAKSIYDNSQASGHAKAAQLWATVKTIPFLPFGSAAVEDLVAHRIETLPCRIRNIKLTTFDQPALKFITQLVIDAGAVEKENGRFVSLKVQELVDEPASVELFRQGVDAFYIAHVSISNEGVLSVSLTVQDSFVRPHDL